MVGRDEVAARDIAVEVVEAGSAPALPRCPAPCCIMRPLQVLQLDVNNGPNCQLQVNSSARLPMCCATACFLCACLFAGMGRA